MNEICKKNIYLAAFRNIEHWLRFYTIGAWQLKNLKCIESKVYEIREHAQNGYLIFSYVYRHEHMRNKNKLKALYRIYMCITHMRIK